MALPPPSLDGAPNPNEDERLRDGQRAYAEQIPVAALQLLRVMLGRRDRKTKRRNTMGETSTLREPTNSLRGALAFDDAAQAALSNPAAETLSKERASALI
jgi:hypothetical protein